MPNYSTLYDKEKYCPIINPYYLEMTFYGPFIKPSYKEIPYENPFYLTFIIQYLKLFGELTIHYHRIEMNWIAFSKQCGQEYMIPNAFNLDRFREYIILLNEFTDEAEWKREDIINEVKEYYEKHKPPVSIDPYFGIDIDDMNGGSTE